MNWPPYKNSTSDFLSTVVLSQSESKDLWLTVTVVELRKDDIDIDVVYLPTKNTELVTRQKAPEKKKKMKKEPRNSTKEIEIKRNNLKCIQMLE